MSDEGDEGAHAQNPAQGHAQNPADHFSGNIMNLKRPVQCSQRKSPRSIKSIQEKVWIYLQRKPR